VEALPRRAILTAAESPQLARLVRRHGMRLGAARFVAGETLDDAVRALRELNDAGLHANTTLLGEAVVDAAATREVAAEYRRVLERLTGEHLRANVALKLTHLGLTLDEELAYENVRSVVVRAGELGTFVRIDMEQSAYVEATLRIYRRLREDGLDCVGTVLQAYLHRTPADLDSLLPLRPNLRLVKGAYLEPPAVALARKADVDAAFVRLIETSLRGPGYTAVATHDEAVIDHVKRFVQREAIGRDRFEFQLLYGIRSRLQRALAAEGFKVLVATPYGPDWYPYLMRRLAERPANLGFFVRNLVRG
jgi:proline dehydrogenase